MSQPRFALRMNGADYLILGVLLLSMLLGCPSRLRPGGDRRARDGSVGSGSHGAMRPCSSLIWAVCSRSRPQAPGRRDIIIVTFVLVIAWLLSGILSYFLRHSGLSIMLDRLLGLFFGFVRGGVVIAVLVLLGQFLELDRVEWWGESRLLPYAIEVGNWLEAFAETGMKVLEA